MLSKDFYSYQDDTLDLNGTDKPPLKRLSNNMVFEMVYFATDLTGFNHIWSKMIIGNF